MENASALCVAGQPACLHLPRRRVLVRAGRPEASSCTPSCPGRPPSCAPAVPLGPHDPPARPAAPLGRPASTRCCRRACPPAGCPAPPACRPAPCGTKAVQNAEQRQHARQQAVPHPAGPRALLCKGALARAGSGRGPAPAWTSMRSVLPSRREWGCPSAPRRAGLVNLCLPAVQPTRAPVPVPMPPAGRPSSPVASGQDIPCRRACRSKRRHLVSKGDKRRQHLCWPPAAARLCHRLVGHAGAGGRQLCGGGLGLG